ncbi:glutathione-dependent formaldehyde-activating [Exidia glandulosa HHB12029]|uniref:Glutathione-dependent formaldehyde-activating n=1 Tax=Exidia glandulosa HHB12029 TaxID=1314781 RepID=A0A165PNA9_EXIGL|nr:glutathione-dependent formaldehyde-activating [Exidia glandulosa HHB12029]
MSVSSALKLFTGSCHCGLVAYSLKIDLAHPKAVKCNCTICLKRGYLTYHTSPAHEFTLVKGKDALKDYQFASHNVHHTFCGTCGVACFFRSGSWTGGGGQEMTSVNLLTIDAGQGLDLTKFKITYFNGANGWEGGGKDTPWPGGQF